MKSLQEKVSQFNTKHKLTMPIEHRILDAVSELGEVSKEVLKMTNYGRNGVKTNTAIVSELGDLLYSIIGVANHFDIALDEALQNVLIKYKKRIEKGGIGSEYNS